MTPAQFHNQYYGWGVDVDHVAGLQCVDFFKKFLAIIGHPHPNSAIGGDGYADWIWYSRVRWEKWFDFIPHGAGTPIKYRDGDIVLFPHKSRGGWTHPSSHVCFYYGGKEFGTNQGGNGHACDKPTNWSDSLGALRWKGWEAMTLKNGFHSFKAGGVDCAVYKGKHIGLLVADEPTEIQNFDGNVAVLSRAGNDLFEMAGTAENPVGTIYGCYSSYDGKKHGFPPQDHTYLYLAEHSDGTVEYGDYHGQTFEDVSYLVSPQMIFADGVTKYADYRGKGILSAKWWQSYVVHFSDGSWGNGVSRGAVVAGEIWNALKALGADMVAIMDGGSGGIGSANMTYWDGNKSVVLQNSGRRVSDMTVIYSNMIEDKPSEVEELKEQIKKLQASITAKNMGIDRAIALLEQAKKD